MTFQKLQDQHTNFFEKAQRCGIFQGTEGRALPLDGRPKDEKFCVPLLWMEAQASSGEWRWLVYLSRVQSPSGLKQRPVLESSK